MGRGCSPAMMLYVMIASLVITLHASFILWIVFGAALTRRRPLLPKTRISPQVAAA